MRFFVELKRRGVLKVATGYLIVSWLTLEIGHTLFNVFELPHQGLQAVFVLLAIGFPAALFITWHRRFGADGAPAHAEGHAGSVHEGPWLAAVFGVVAVFAVGVAVAVRFFGMGHAGSHATAEPATAGAPAAHTASASPTDDKSIAVLPFADMSEAGDQAYFADGMAEEILDLLSKIPALKVIARTSSFQFKGKGADVRSIGQSLGVASILEGSVRKAGAHLRITTQLVRASDGSHIWSETYDRQLDDVFKVQDEIAGAVVQQLRVSLIDGARPASAAPTTNAEAHALYLQARYLHARETPEDITKALGLYQRVTELDPKFAPAWAGIALAYGRRVANGEETNGSGFAKQHAAAERAIAIDPNYAPGYVALGIGYMQYSFDWQKAAAAVARARELDPNDAEVLAVTGHLARVLGTTDESIKWFQEAIARDPLSLLTRRYLAMAYHYAGRDAEAEAELRHAIALDDNFPALHYFLGRVLLSRGDAKGAFAAFSAEPGPAWHEFGMTLAYRALGRTAEANAALATQLAHPDGSEYQAAESYAYFGNADKAFEWLEQARTQHDPGVMWMRRDRLLAPLEKDPRYAAFLKRMNLEVPAPGT